MRQHPLVSREFGLHSIILFASLDFFPRISKHPPPPLIYSSFQQASNQTLFPLQKKKPFPPYELIENSNIQN